MDNTDNKRIKFSPGSIEEVERQTIARLVGPVDRYAVPNEFRGRTQTVWDTLVEAFPAPVLYAAPASVNSDWIKSSDLRLFSASISYLYLLQVCNCDETRSGIFPRYYGDSGH